MKPTLLALVFLCGCHSAPRPSIVASDINQAVTRGMTQSVPTTAVDYEWVIQAPGWSKPGPQQGAELVCEGSGPKTITHCELEHGMTLEMVMQIIVDREPELKQQ
jgi:hypothetical protein